MKEKGQIFLTEEFQICEHMPLQQMELNFPFSKCELDLLTPF